MNDQDLVPDRLGAYRLLDRIGEGGMGVVYLARDQGHKTVALKVLRSTVAGDPTARRRLAREVETMQRVRSPYVAEVIDADLTGPTPYIVTRFVPGRTLDDLVTQCGPLRGTALARLATGLAEALVAVHAAGVVHRDLKPSNVMIMHDTPVVIDFGIAQGPDATRLTMTGMFMGTPGYLAPEVIEGRPSSEASDVHAWGATVSYAATGRPPFGGGSYETIFYRIVNGQADLGGTPMPLVPLLAAALARDPAHRPTAIQLRAQAGVLDAGALVQTQQINGAPPVAAHGPGATRADLAPAPTYADPGLAAAGAVAAGLPPLAGLPPVVGPPVGGLPPMSLPQTVTAADGAGYGPGAAGVTAMPARPVDVAALSGTTRPIAGQLPDDLGDVLTPVRYQRAGRNRDAGAVAVPAADGLARPATGDRAAGRGTRWHPVLVLAAVVVVASVAVVLPVAGTVAGLAFFAALRTAGLVQRRSAVRRMARGARGSNVLLTVLTLPWFILRALVAIILIAPLALAAAAVAAGAAVAASPTAWPDRALAFAAGGLVLFYGLGPGSGMPRTQLRRFFGAVARTTPAQVLTLCAMTVLTAAALSAAVSWPSAFWPTVVPQGFTRFGMQHIVPLHWLGFHLTLVHHIQGVPGYLLHRLQQWRSG